MTTAEETDDERPRHIGGNKEKTRTRFGSGFVDGLDAGGAVGCRTRS